MSTTLQQTINWAQTFVQYAPLTAGVGNELAISIANEVVSTITAAPFTWPWNRAEYTELVLQEGVQDYTVPLANFGFLEKVTLITADGKYAYEIKDVYNTLPLGVSISDYAEPKAVSVGLAPSPADLVMVCFPQTLGSELLLNGGFETGDFTGWTGHVNMSIVTTPTHSGGYAAQTTVGLSASTLTAVNLSEPTGGAYRFSFWQYVTSAGTSVDENEFQNANVAATLRSPNHPTGVWKQFFSHILWNSSINPTGPLFAFSTRSVPWYVDDVSVKQITGVGHIITANNVGWNFNCPPVSVEFWFITTTTEGGIFVSNGTNNTGMTLVPPNKCFRCSWIRMGTSESPTVILTALIVSTSLRAYFPRL